MKRVTTLVACSLFLACSTALAEDSNLQQQKYFNLWKPHAGEWNISIKEAGKKDIIGTYSYEPSPSKLCYVGRGYSNDGTTEGDGLYFYDSARKCWVDVEVFKAVVTFESDCRVRAAGHGRRTPTVCRII
jgi:hypothetical protein